VERCPHKWTVRYTVNGVQRERSFADEMDAGKRVRPGTGLKKAQDFQLELTRGKRAQGKTYTDPKLAEESFMANAAALVTKSARLQASEQTRKSYLGLLNGDIAKAFGDRTLAQMSTPEAAEEVGTPYLPYFTARGRFAALTAAMGITGYTTHSLRHQFASEALDQGANIANIAAILGHRTVETTLRIYVHPTEDAEARMRDMMNDRWGTREAEGSKAA
jgi:hypothetical protein